MPQRKRTNWGEAPMSGAIDRTDAASAGSELTNFAEQSYFQLCALNPAKLIWITTGSPPLGSLREMRLTNLIHCPKWET